MRRSWGRQGQRIKREAIIPLSLRRFVEILNTVMLRTVTRQLQKESVMLRLGPVVLTERGVVSFGASCVGGKGRTSAICCEGASGGLASTYVT